MSNLFTPFDELIQKHSISLTFKMIWSYVILQKGLMYLFFITLFVGYFFPILLLFFSPLLVFTILQLTIIGKGLFQTKNFYNFLRTMKKNNFYDKALEENFFLSSLGLLFGWGTLFITGTILFIIFFITLESLHDKFLIEELFQLVNYHYSLYLIPLALLIFIYLQPLVLSKFLKSTHFWDGYLSAFYIFSPFVWRDALKIKYIKYLLSLFLIILMVAFLFFMITDLMGTLFNFDGYLIFIGFIGTVVMTLYFIVVFILMTTLVASRLVNNK